MTVAPLRHVLLLSGGGFQGLSLVKALRARGNVRIVIADCYDVNVGRSFCDRYHVVAPLAEEDRLFTALEQICTFIGAQFDPACFPQSDRRYNVSQEVDMPDAVRTALRDLYRNQVVAVAERMDRVPADWRDEFGLT